MCGTGGGACRCFLGRARRRAQGFRVRHLDGTRTRAHPFSRRFAGLPLRCTDASILNCPRHKNSCSATRREHTERGALPYLFEYDELRSTY